MAARRGRATRKASDRNVPQRDARCAPELRHSRPFTTLGELWGIEERLPTVREVTGEANASRDRAALLPSWSEDTWSSLVTLFGKPAEPDFRAADLRAEIEEAMLAYFAWAPDGHRPPRLDAKHLRGRRVAQDAGLLGGMATAARTLREALEPSGDTPVAHAEYVYLRERLGRTGSGVWVDFDALIPILQAVEDAAVDARTMLPAPDRGPWQDDAFRDLVVGLAHIYEWWTGRRPSRSEARDMDRKRHPWDLTGSFGAILEIVKDGILGLRGRRGLTDIARRQLAALYRTR